MSPAGSRPRGALLWTQDTPEKSADAQGQGGGGVLLHVYVQASWLLGFPFSPPTRPSLWGSRASHLHAHWLPSQSIANEEHSEVLKLLHLDTVGPWIEGELDADLPNMPAVCCPTGTDSATTTPHNTARLRHLTPTLPH